MECGQTGLTAVGHMHLMALAFEQFFEQLTQQRFIIDAKDSQLRDGGRF